VGWDVPVKNRNEHPQTASEQQHQPREKIIMKTQKTTKPWRRQGLRLNLVMAVLGATTLLCQPLVLNAQQGGGKGKPGGGGGDEPPPPTDGPMPTYAVKRIVLPDGMFVPSSLGMSDLNSAGHACGPTAIQVANNTYVWGPAFVWDGENVILLPGDQDRTAGEATGLSDPTATQVLGIAVGRIWDPEDASVTVEAVAWQPTAGAYASVLFWNDLRPEGFQWHLQETRRITADARYVVFEALRDLDGKREALVAEVLFDEHGLISGLANFLPIGTFEDALESVTGTELSWANDIHHNSEGTVRVTGYAISEQGTGNVFVWERDAQGNQFMTDLDRGHGQGLNALGQVVAFRWLSGTGYRGLYWDFDGNEFIGPTELTLESGQQSTARALNDSGYVVGWADRQVRRNNVDRHAYIWHPEKGIWSLNELLAPDPTLGNKFHLNNPTRINSHGQILARASEQNSDAFWVRLDPVP
jgi:hypothetical protein